MKYRRLTREQFKEFHLEFAGFLASQGIDQAKWTALKQENSPLIDEMLDLFSTMIWEQLLQRECYIEHVSEHIWNGFKCGKENIVRIVIKSETKNLLNKSDFQEVIKNLLDSTDCELLYGTKKYTADREAEIFSLIEMGGTFSNSTLFEKMEQLIGNDVV